MNNLIFLRESAKKKLASKKNMTELPKTNNGKALEASYLLSYKVAQAGKAHITAETLIKLCAVDIARCLSDEKAVDLVSNIQL